MSIFAIFSTTIVLSLIIIIPFIIGIYVYRDANRRGMNAILWALVAAAAPGLMGIIIYLLVRGSYSDLRCQNCDSPVKEQFVVCPKCGTKLRASCLNCATPVEADWKVCPKCTQPLTEVQADVRRPVRAKDRAIWNVLVIVIIIPIILISILILSMSVSFSGGGTSCREVTTREYFEEMNREVDGNISEKVNEWLDNTDITQTGAYALRYEHSTDTGKEHYFLIYVPSVGGKQVQSGIGQSSSIFGTTLTLNLSGSSGESTLFNIICSSADEVPNLKVTIDGKKIPCTVTTVNYNPTLFYTVP